MSTRVPAASSRARRATTTRPGPTVTVARFYDVTIEGTRRRLSEAEYRAEAARAARRIALGLELTEQEAAFNRREHEAHLRERGVTGRISEWVGDAPPPLPAIWDWSRGPIDRGRTALGEGRIDVAARQLGIAQEALATAKREWREYIETSIGGAQTTAEALEFTRDISFAIAIGTAAIVAAPVVAAGAATAAAGAGLTGAAATTATVVGTGLTVTAGGALVGGTARATTSAAGQALAGGPISIAQVTREGLEGAKRGAVDAGSAVVGLGAGKVLGVGAKGAGLARRTLAGAGAGGAGGTFGGGLGATLEGKSGREIVQESVKGALTGTVGGAFGGAASKLAGPKATAGTILAADVVGGAGGAAAGTALLGGSREEIKRAALSGALGSLAGSGGPPRPKRLRGTPALDRGPRPTREVPLGEVDLGPPLKDSGLELDTGPQPTREVPLGEVDLGPPLKDSGLKPYRGGKPVGAIPGVTKPKATFGEPSQEKGGTENRSGMHFHEYDAAEVAINLRVDWDPVAGRPRKVSYDVPPDVGRFDPESTRSFARNTATEGAQPTSSAFKGSKLQRGHLAQREAGKGSKDVERALDAWTNVVPMAEGLNQGPAWRSAEAQAIALAKKHGGARVEIEVVYDASPKRLPDGTPIPSGFKRTVTLPNGRRITYPIFTNE